MQSAGREAPPRWLLTHLQESVELLLFVPIHISLLKELEIRDEATTWSDIPAGSVLRWAQGSEMRERGRTGEGVLGVWFHPGWAVGADDCWVGTGIVCSWGRLCPAWSLLSNPPPQYSPLLLISSAPSSLFSFLSRFPPRSTKWGL